MEGGFYHDSKIRTKLSRWKPSQKIQKKERPVKKLVVGDRPTFPEGSCQQFPGFGLN